MTNQITEVASLLHHPEDSDIGIQDDDASEHLVLDEFYFNHSIMREFRRSERSEIPFHLVLIESKALFLHYISEKFWAELIETVKGQIRGSDICGWYKQKSVFGIILLEASESSVVLLKERLYGQFLDNLHTTVSDLFEITAHSFPKVAQLSEEHSLVVEPDVLKKNTIAPLVLLGNASKRSLDILGSVTLILVFSPFLLIIPLLIKMGSKGPVFFAQKRIGRQGKLFTFLKFRSMVVNNDNAIHREYVAKLITGANKADGAADEPVFKMKNDPRITPIGRILRKTSLDELPQLFNVLIGDMSLVGPRPAIPYEVENYRLWHQHRVVDIKPGITGFWQVTGRSSTSFETMVRMDIFYIRNRSLLLDLKLLLKTPLAMFKGAY